MSSEIDKKWFFLTQDGDLGIRFNNEFGNPCDRVLDTRKDLNEFLQLSVVSDRFIKFYNKLVGVLSVK